MSEGKTYQIYTHEDIRRYLNGEMNSAEMYALEKMAIQDPFLSDAIDGYNGISSQAVEQDLEYLYNFGNNPNENIVIPISTAKNAFPWLKLGIAATFLGVVVVFGLRYFSGKKDNNNLAAGSPATKAEQVIVPSGTVTETPAPVNEPIIAYGQLGDSGLAGLKNKTAVNKKAGVVFVKPEKLDEYYATFEPAEPMEEKPGAFREKNDQIKVTAEKIEMDGKVSDTILQKDAFKNGRKLEQQDLAKNKEKMEMQKKLPPKTLPAPTPVTANKNIDIDDYFSKERQIRNDSQVLSNNSRIGNESVMNSNTQGNFSTYNNATLSAPSVNSEVVTTGFGNNRFSNVNQSRSFRFNYQIKDKQGNLIPYTNVSVPADQLVTYTRVDGKFGLFSTDSVLKVNIKAAGYEPLTLQLKSNNSYNPIILNDAKINTEVVVVGVADKSKQLAKSTKLIAKVEEAEPQEGLDNYNSYIANNINIGAIPKGEVVLSFDIKKSGEPTNIIVNQSLSAAADSEAIRLLSEGPKWKNKKRKKSKGKIVIKF